MEGSFKPRTLAAHVVWASPADAASAWRSFNACVVPPGDTLKRMVEIKLPRPRSSEIVSSDDFGRYVAQIWSDLREEASKGLKDDEARRDGDGLVDRPIDRRGARRHGARDERRGPRRGLRSDAAAVSRRRRGLIPQLTRRIAGGRQRPPERRSHRRQEGVDMLGRPLCRLDLAGAGVPLPPRGGVAAAQMPVLAQHHRDRSRAV